MSAAVLVCCWLSFALPAAAAQSVTSAIEIVVTDEAGRPLAGVRVDLTGAAAASVVTDAKGTGRIANLPAGEYLVAATQSGRPAFRVPSPVAVTGQRWLVAIQLGASGGSATVTQRPIDGRAFDLGLAESRAVGAGRPLLSRDPFSLLQLVPGIVLDRLVIGDGEIGLPVTLLSKGASSEETTWTVDGVPITDMSALGQPLALFNFIALQQVRVTTAGADPRRPTAGAGVDLALRDRSRQPFGGSAHLYVTGDRLQGENISEDLIGQLPSYRRLRSGFDAGLEGGGLLPFGRDLSGWVSYGAAASRQNVLTFDPEETAYFVLAPDDSTIQQAAGTLRTRRASTGLSFAYALSRKAREGRDVSHTRQPETGLDESATAHVVAASMHRTFGEALTMVARYGHVRSRLALEPLGGRSTVAFLDDAGVWHNTFRADTSRQTQHALIADGTYVMGTHEVSFGAGWRRAAVDRLSMWPGGQLNRHVGYPILLAEAVRDLQTAGHGAVVHAYVSDAFRLGPLMIDAGLRVDRQTSAVDPAGVGANPIAPADLPAASVASRSNLIVWTTVAPRVSGSLPIGRSGRTILRGSFGVFAVPLAADLAALIEGLPQRSRTFIAVADLNGNQIFDSADVSTPIETEIFNSRVGVHAAPRAEEVNVALDRAVGSRVSLRAGYTWRRWTGYNWLRFDGVTGSDFLPGGHVTGSSNPTGAFDVPFFVLDTGVLSDDLLRVFDARDGYRQEYQGVDVTLARRPGPGWSWSLSVSGGTHTEVFDSLDAIFDPTPLVPSSAPFNTASPSLQGGFVLRETTGDAESGTYLMAPRYQMIATASGPLAGRLDVTINYLARQGFAAPFFVGGVFGSTDPTSDGAKRVLVTGRVDDSRLPLVHVVDLRASYPFVLASRRAAFEVAVFNLLNSATPLARGFDLQLPSFTQVRAVMSPRVVRFGVRVGW
jgi:hypothetical protein